MGSAVRMIQAIVSLRVDVSYFLCCTRKREICVTASLIVRLQAVPLWSVKRVRSQRSETGASRNKREEIGGEARRRGTTLLAVTNGWSINNSCCQTSLMCNLKLLHTFGCQHFRLLGKWLQS